MELIKKKPGKLVWCSTGTCSASREQHLFSLDEMTVKKNKLDHICLQLLSAYSGVVVNIDILKKSGDRSQRRAMLKWELHPECILLHVKHLC